MTNPAIKGRLISAGRIVTVDNYPAEFADDLNFETVDGLLIAMSREAVAAAAGTMFGREIEVRLHGLQDAGVSYDIQDIARVAKYPWVRHRCGRGEVSP